MLGFILYTLTYLKYTVLCRPDTYDKGAHSALLNLFRDNQLHELDKIYQKFPVHANHCVGARNLPDSYGETFFALRTIFMYKFNIISPYPKVIGECGVQFFFDYHNHPSYGALPPRQFLSYIMSARKQNLIDMPKIITLEAVAKQYHQERALRA